MTAGRYSRALNQALSIEASPELHPLRETNFQTSYQFSPRALPWLVYDLYVYSEQGNGVGVSFGVSKQSLPDVARHLGHSSTEELDEALPGMDALGVKTLNLGDMTVIQDCYSAVLKALDLWIEDHPTISSIFFEADSEDASRIRFYRRFAQIVKNTFDFWGPIVEDKDESYVYFKVYKEDPEDDHDHA